MAHQIETTHGPSLSNKAVRFVLAGCISAGVNWAARIVLSLFIPYATAIVIAYIIGLAAGYILYSRFVFPAGEPHPPSSIIKYLGVNAVSLGILLLVALWLVEVLAPIMALSVAEALAHAAGLIIGAVFSFFAHKNLTFRAPAGSV